MKDGEARGQIFMACCSLAGSFGVTDNVDEKGHGRSQPDLFFRFGRHSGTDLSYASFIIYSTCWCREQRRRLKILAIVSALRKRRFARSADRRGAGPRAGRSEEHTSELQSP